MTQHPKERPQGGEATGYWWCAYCREELNGSHVTFQEYHESCGRPAEWIELTAPSYANLTKRVALYEKALEKIAAYGSNEVEPGNEGLTGWQILALNPQAAVDIAKEALNSTHNQAKEGEAL